MHGSLTAPCSRCACTVLDAKGAYDAITEACWRDLLAAFGLSWRMPPRTTARVAFFGGALAAVSGRCKLHHPTHILSHPFLGKLQNPTYLQAAHPCIVSTSSNLPSPPNPLR